MTEALVAVGVIAAVVFVAVVLVEGALRSGYDPAYHTGSELELGERGWVQRANFFLMGGAMFAFAIGVERALDTVIAPVLLAIFGFGMVIAGAFVPDPVRGYPPGAPTEPSATPTPQAPVHNVVSPVAFFAIFGACIALAFELDGGWRIYTALTAIVGLVLTVSTAVAFQRDARHTGLIQRALVLVYWSWIAALGVHLL